MTVPFNKVGKIGKEIGFGNKKEKTVFQTMTTGYFNRDIKDTVGFKRIKLRGDFYVGHR